MDDASSTPPDQITDAGEHDDGIEYIPVHVKIGTASASAESRHTPVQSVPMADVHPDGFYNKISDEAMPDNEAATASQQANQQVAISGKDVIQQALVKLLGLARREVLIIMPYMHELFDDKRISQGLLDFIRHSPKRDVLMLLNSLADQQASTHQLVKLAQRISSRVQLKQVNSLLEPPVMESDYLVVIDRMHILRIDDIDTYSAWFDVNFASRAQKYAASLLQQWPKAKEIAEFRQFKL